MEKAGPTELREKELKLKSVKEEITSMNACAGSYAILRHKAREAEALEK